MNDFEPLFALFLIEFVINFGIALSAVERRSNAAALNVFGNVGNAVAAFFAVHAAATFEYARYPPEKKHHRYYGCNHDERKPAAHHTHPYQYGDDFYNVEY